MARKKHNRTLLGIILWLFGFTLFNALPGYFAEYLIFFVLALLLITLAIIKSAR